MDFEKYKIKMTVRTACLYEQLTGRSFFKCGESEEDGMVLIYASLVTNNDDLFMTYKTFLTLIKDRKVSRWIERENRRLMEFNAQLKNTVEEDEETEKKSGDGEPMKMMDIASALIMQHNIDPHYVMDEMQMWEIMPFFKTAENVKRAELVEKRFWTYLQVMPMMEGKKLKSPEDLVPFEWEADEKKKKIERELKNNTEVAKNLIGKTFDWIK